MIRTKLIAAMATLALLGGCDAGPGYHPPVGQKVAITQKVYQAYQEYLTTVGSTHPGAFVVSDNGQDYSYWYCPATRCVSGPSDAQKALHDCESWGDRCYVLANGATANYEFNVVK
jgi:hypothetical protein